MERCPFCEGRGWKPKHKNCYHSQYEGYILGCHEERMCHKCLATGSTGAMLIRAALLEIKLESKDLNSRKLAEQALNEFAKE